MTVDVHSLRTVFMGSPDFAVPFLEALVRGGFDVRGVVTQPDRPRGRGQEVNPVPVKVWALNHEIPAVSPLSLRDPVGREFLERWDPELIVVVAYGKILPIEVLNFPARGCVNVHASLLPAYRGASPIVWAIKNGETLTGLSLMCLDRGMDTGPVFAKREIPVDKRETTRTLTAKMMEQGPDFMLEGLRGYLKGDLVPVPQPPEGTVAPLLSKEDGRIPFSGSAAVVDCHVRAMNPWPGAFFSSSIGTVKVGEGSVLDIKATAPPGTVLSLSPEGIDVACGEGVFRILALQREGGRMIPVREFVSGRIFKAGELFF
ncbi:MAG: methionyl-tRNA formyltransferase [Leptospirillia bacterium]